MGVPTKAEVRDNVNILFQNAPVASVGDAQIEVCVVAKRCVYLNNHRIAGGKPYVSENLPQHTLKTSLSEVLNAFSEKEIRAALKERKARRDYFAAYHAQPDEAQS